MSDNINENNLRAFAVKLNISPKHGWKKTLARRFGKNYSSIISDWINEGVPENFQSLCENAEPVIDFKLWEDIVSETNDIVDDDTGKGERTASAPLLRTGTDGFSALLGQAGAVLQSDTVYAEALKKNIEAFFYGINSEKKPPVKEKLVSSEGPPGGPKKAAGGAG